MPPQETPTTPVHVPNNKNNTIIGIIAAIIIIALIAFAVIHSKKSTELSAQNAVLQSGVSTASTTSTSSALMRGMEKTVSTNPAFTTYTGSADTFFSFTYPTSLKLTQFPSGVSLVATATDPLAVGIPAGDPLEFDVYIGEDTEKQVRQSLVIGSVNKVMDPPTEGYTTYDLVLQHVVYHIIEVYMDQGNDLELVAQASYNTAASSTSPWALAYKGIVSSISINQAQLASFIADAKARGAAQKAAVTVTPVSTSLSTTTASTTAQAH